MSGTGQGGEGVRLTSSRAVVSTLKPWLVSMVCRLSRLESMASKCSLSSALAGGSGHFRPCPRHPHPEAFPCSHSPPCLGPEE